MPSVNGQEGDHDQLTEQLVASLTHHPEAFQRLIMPPRCRKR